ncbi:MAG TPA: radical SAM family heme chaperone HemW [Vicinamibacterales bacterium]|nr:radical SAM family heme chaperone HemW [Vicinamibacterales bacterium]
MAPGLYLHVPFCSAICSYCTFTRGLFDRDLKTAYVRALASEIRAAAAQYAGDSAPPDTIYFGGGTPSLLEPAEIETLVSTCAECFGLTAGAEITLEVNPETVDEPRLAAFRRAGVTRVSLGVQSFHDEELRRLGRMHDAARARRAVHEARAAGFDNISVDLMMWLPEQSLADWLDNVEALVALAPEHASLYLLELHAGVPLREHMLARGWSQAPDDDAAAMYEGALERLDAAGYEQYEISNVARPGHESRHNQKYWRDGDWLGFGCGAHSSWRGVRWYNVAATTAYVQRLARGESPVAGRRVLTPAERFEEAVITGLRLAEGIAPAELAARYGIDLRERYGTALAPFLEAGLLVDDGARLRLTRQGMLVANEVLAVFV